jgi:two-component system heavy metal sensor histidine kinase CusS
VALVLCALGGYRIARRGIRPVEEIAATARRVHASHFERIPPGGLPGELRTLADTFNRMLDRLQESIARLSRFSADIAHELRTPLNNLRGEIEVTLSKPRTADEYSETLGSALEECGRLAQLIDSLLFLARAEDPKTQIQREPFDLRRELESLRDFYDAAANDAGVRLMVEADGEQPVTMNRPLIQRAVGNLIANALSHTPSGGTVTLSTSRDDEGILITVRDTGRGIPPEHLPHIFDRFYRADPARTGGGVGLGLAIVKSIVELHGGTVSAESEFERGTTVTVRFPKE